MLALKVQGTKWRIRFTPSSGPIDCRRRKAQRPGAAGRKALGEAV